VDRLGGSLDVDEGIALQPQLNVRLQFELGTYELAEATKEANKAHVGVGSGISWPERAGDITCVERR